MSLSPSIVIRRKGLSQSMFYYVGPCVALSLNHSTWTSIENYPLPILQKRLWQAAKDFLYLI